MEVAEYTGLGLGEWTDLGGWLSFYHPSRSWSSQAFGGYSASLAGVLSQLQAKSAAFPPLQALLMCPRSLWKSESAPPSTGILQWGSL